LEEVIPMAIGTCRRDGCSNPRRVRRGMVEPLCEECYREAMDKVARELEAEAREGRRARYRKFELKASARPADKAPERVAPIARASAGPRADRAERGQPAGSGGARQRRGPRCISEELLLEARRLYRLGLSLRAVAETLLDQTRYANANSAEVALRCQFTRRGWPLRSRREAGALRGRRSQHRPLAAGERRHNERSNA
jgi:hypothetical protein